MGCSQAPAPPPCALAKAALSPGEAEAPPGLEEANGLHIIRRPRGQEAEGPGAGQVAPWVPMTQRNSARLQAQVAAAPSCVLGREAQPPSSR